MKQRVPGRTWYSAAERRRPRLLIEDDHPALEISDFAAFRDAGFDVAFCSGPGGSPGPTSCCRGSREAWWPTSGGGIRNCR